MREENYLIALFNRDILDLSAALPGPFAGRRIGGQLTRLLEWNIRFCLLGFLFGPDGQVRRAFTSERNRAELTEALERRFLLMACINAVLAPFVFIYLLLYSFFRYFEVRAQRHI
jgi:autophagy-related protein 9